MRLPIPRHVFLEVHMECNLRCVLCDIHKLKNPEGELTAAERKGVIRQVSEWNPEIRVVLGGGEAFARKGMLYDVAGEARRRGVYVTVSTNGTLIRPPDVERLPASGIRCVVVSLDSDEPDIHDRIRGRRGTFRRAVQAVREIAAARDRSHEDFTVLTSTILGRHNLTRVGRMVEFFEGLGADTMLFQPIQAPFARAVATRWWETEPLFPTSPRDVDAGVDALIRLRLHGRRLLQTVEQFEDMRHYFRHPGLLQPGQCDSMNKNLMVDMRGDVRLCFNMQRIGLSPIGSVRTRTLRDLWEDAEVAPVRERMRACLEGCGSMICHAR